MYRSPLRSPADTAGSRSRTVAIDDRRLTSALAMLSYFPLIYASSAHVRFPHSFICVAAGRHANQRTSGMHAITAPIASWQQRRPLRPDNGPCSPFGVRFAPDNVLSSVRRPTNGRYVEPIRTGPPSGTVRPPCSTSLPAPPDSLPRRRVGKWATRDKRSDKIRWCCERAALLRFRSTELVLDQLRL